MKTTLSILLVEDNPGDADLIQEIMPETGLAAFEFEVAGRLSEAVERLQERSYHLILLDLGLPDTNGLDTLIKVQKEASRIPIVVLTGNDDEAAGVTAVKQGAQDYLVKGKASGDLLMRVFLHAVERHQHQIKLRESESFLRASLDALSAHIAILDTSGEILSVNRAWRQFGIQNGLDPADFHPGVNYLSRCDQAEGEDASIARAFAAGIRSVIRGDKDLFEMEYPCHSPDKQRWFFGRVTPFPGRENRKVVVAHENITDRKKAEMARRNSELRLRTILDAQPSRVILLDTDLKVLWPNRQACHSAGLVRQQIIGRPCHEIWHQEPEICTECPVAEAIQKEKPCKARKTTPDGRTWQILGCPIWDDSGYIVSAVEVAEDITDRIVMETQLRKAQKAESLGTLAGGITHDFNNILAAVIGYVRLTLGEVPKGSKAHYNLNQVITAIDRAKNLIRQILVFCRQTEQEFHPINISPVVKESLKLLRASLPAFIEIVKNIPSEPGNIVGDPSQIHQIMMNLCTNAAHAMKEKGGILSISVSNTCLAPGQVVNKPDMKPGQYVVLTVSDTGHGIDPSIKDRIFDPYFTTKEIYEGTGMGLAVVYGIAKNHGGEITCYSEPGEGTEFRVYLPMVEKKAKPVAQKPGVSRGKGERILFVDDEVLLVDIASQTLKKMGYHVGAFNDSREALAVFQENPDDFDLVATDYTMPKMTGTQLAGEIKRIRPQIPIVLITGFSDRVNPKNLKEFHVDGYLLKPWDDDELSAIIRRLLDGDGLQ